MPQYEAEYIQWPGSATVPGDHTFPGWDDRADGTTTVHSHRGWAWVETTNEYQKAVTSLAQGAIEAAVRRVRTAFGRVSYIKGGPEVPPFNGEAPGDTCRVQDAGTLDIVAEWRWTGTAWERMRVSGEQVSNLDVGRLTAGSASIPEIAARRIASDVGRFLSLSTEQLTVSDSASFNAAIARTIWSKIVHATVGEFEKIRAGMLDANVFQGQTFIGGLFRGAVVEGGEIRTAATGDRTVMDSQGIHIHKGGKVVADLSPARPNGLALTNPATNDLTDVASVVFGAEGFAWSPATADGYVGPDTTGYLRRAFTITSPRSGRLVYTITGDYNMGSVSAIYRWAQIKIDGRVVFTSQNQYRNAGWDSDVWTLAGLASGIKTTGTSTVEISYWFGISASSALLRWNLSAINGFVIPA